MNKHLDVVEKAIPEGKEEVGFVFSSTINLRRTRHRQRPLVSNELDRTYEDEKENKKKKKNLF